MAGLPFLKALLLLSHIGNGKMNGLEIYPQNLMMRAGNMQLISQEGILEPRENCLLLEDPNGPDTSHMMVLESGSGYNGRRTERTHFKILLLVVHCFHDSPLDISLFGP